MNINIRKAGPEDFSTILTLIKEFSIFQKTPEKVTITLEQMVAEKDISQCLVAETNDGEIVAFATYFFAYYSWSGKALYLDDLYVKETFRKQAIGKKLLDSIISIGKNEHCKKIRWQVSGWNSAAIDFYKKMGAVIDETEINCDLVIRTN
ncbi:MAG: GNAT family N-acetyltransferase [Ferruginibacter sp.]